MCYKGCAASAWDSSVPGSFMRAHRPPLSDLPLQPRPALPGSSSVLRSLSFQSLTNCPICKPFVLITLQQYRGCGYPLPHPHSSLHPSRSAANCWLSPSLTPLESALTSHPQILENTAPL